MTDEELKQKAEEYVLGLYKADPYAFPFGGDEMRAAYFVGAKENSPTWHYPSKGKLPEESVATVEYTNYRKSTGAFYRQFRVIRTLAIFEKHGVRKIDIALFDTEGETFASLKCNNDKGNVIAWQYLPGPPGGGKKWAIHTQNIGIATKRPGGWNEGIQ